jgi:hypothetical protein
LGFDLQRKAIMAKGKAHGQDRDYQVLCRDILQTANISIPLTPYCDDGIDVQFVKLGGTDITFDVALKDSDDNLVVAECRRRKEVVKQEAIFAFAHKVELLRKQTGHSIAGIFLTKSRYQIGALKHASWSGIQAIVLDQKQSIQNFVLAYQKYDPQREKRLQEALGHFTGTISPIGSLSIQVIRKGGSTEDFGRVG